MPSRKSPVRALNRIDASELDGSAWTPASTKRRRSPAHRAPVEAYPVSEERKVKPTALPAAHGKPSSAKGAVFTFAGFAGTTNGSFFHTPDWVDSSKPPGTTSQAAAYCPSPQWYAHLFSGYSLFFSPNLVWLAIALFDYFVFPYDFAAAEKGYSATWILPRLVVNATITLGYSSFWHVTLYWLGFGQRPFKADRQWRWGKILHNLWYHCLGIAQWTGFEVLFMRAYSTGRLPYLTDVEALASTAGMLNFVASCFWVPVWRTFHFYFAHRLLHVRPLYKFVHSLHHRVRRHGAKSIVACAPSTAVCRAVV